MPPEGGCRGGCGGCGGRGGSSRAGRRAGGGGGAGAGRRAGGDAAHADAAAQEERVSEPEAGQDAEALVEARQAAEAEDPVEALLARRLQPFRVRFADWVPVPALARRARRCHARDPTRCEQACNEQGKDCVPVTYTRACDVVCTRDPVVRATDVGQIDFDDPAQPFGALGPPKPEISQEERQAGFVDEDEDFPQDDEGEGGGGEKPIYNACKILDPGNGQLFFLVSGTHHLLPPPRMDDDDEGYPAPLPVVHELPVRMPQHVEAVRRRFEAYAAASDPPEEDDAALEGEDDGWVPFEGGDGDEDLDWLGGEEEEEGEGEEAEGGPGGVAFTRAQITGLWVVGGLIVAIALALVVRAILALGDASAAGAAGRRARWPWAPRIKSRRGRHGKGNAPDGKPVPVPALPGKARGPRGDPAPRRP